MEWIIGITTSIVASILILLVARTSGLVSISVARHSRQRKLASRLIEGGMTNLFVTRADYDRHRGIPTLMGYLATARQSVLVVGYWMAQGSEVEDISKIRVMILSNPNLQVHIALIHPRGPHIGGLAEHLGETPQSITDRCQRTLQKLGAVREGLPPEARQRMRIRTYKSAPVASIIVLDGGSTDGRVQVDLKPYLTSRDSSVGFEACGNGKPLFEVWRRAAELRFEQAQDWVG